MSIRKIVFALAVAFLLTITLVSCQKAAPEDNSQKTNAEVREDTLPPPEEQAASETGIPELDEAIRELKAKNAVYAVGAGESSDEMIARSISADNARARIAIDAAQNRNLQTDRTENGEVRRETASANISGATVYKTVTQYDEKSGIYKVYSLAILRTET
jgi:mannitol-specific phosphotransferase system IIBC component